jgi:hypothetical protein
MVREIIDGVSTDGQGTALILSHTYLEEGMEMGRWTRFESGPPPTAADSQPSSASEQKLKKEQTKK